MMKTALIGYGKMGRAIENVATSCGAEIVARIDPTAEDADSKEITPEAVANADVCIDFSHPAAVLSSLKKIAATGKPWVIGTTGWYHQLDEARSLVQEYGLAMIVAQNFSLGMNLFLQMVEEATLLANSVAGYDVALSETHHRHKADAPSGTANIIAEILLRNTTGKTTIAHELASKKIDPAALHVSSARVGSVPGTHTVTFSSAEDTITLTHQAHDRAAWARGALQAGKWIQGKKGLFNMSDMMEVFQCNYPE